MNRIWIILAVLFVMVSPFWYMPVIIDDLRHPDIWNEDRTHDPRIYLPVLGCLVLFGVAWAGRRWQVHLRDVEADIRRLTREMEERYGAPKGC